MKAEDKSKATKDEPVLAEDEPDGNMHSKVFRLSHYSRFDYNQSMVFLKEKKFCFLIKKYKSIKLLFSKKGYFE